MVQSARLCGVQRLVKILVLAAEFFKFMGSEAESRGCNDVSLSLNPVKALNPTAKTLNPESAFVLQALRVRAHVRTESPR